MSQIKKLEEKVAQAEKKVAELTKEAQELRDSHPITRATVFLNWAKEKIQNGLSELVVQSEKYYQLASPKLKEYSAKFIAEATKVWEVVEKWLSKEALPFYQKHVGPALQQIFQLALQKRSEVENLVRSHTLQNEQLRPYSEQITFAVGLLAIGAIPFILSLMFVCCCCCSRKRTKTPQPDSKKQLETAKKRK